MGTEQYELFDKENVNIRAQINDDSGTMIYFILESNKFAGCGPIYFNAETLRSAIDSLSKMQKTLAGEVILKDIESAAYFIQLKFVNHALSVSGCIGDYDQHQLCFGFLADQTILGLLLHILRKLDC